MSLSEKRIACECQMLNGKMIWVCDEEDIKEFIQEAQEELKEDEDVYKVKYKDSVEKAVDKAEKQGIEETESLITEFELRRLIVVGWNACDIFNKKKIDKVFKNKFGELAGSMK